MKALLIIIFITLSLFAGKSPLTPSAEYALSKGIKVINVTDAIALQKKGGLLLDTRRVPEFAVEHLKDAISTYYIEKGGKPNKKIDYDASKDSIITSELTKDLSTPLISYCNGPRCWRSYKAAVMLKQDLHYQNVYWLRDGVPAWKKAELPIANIEAEPKEGRSTNFQLKDISWEIYLGILFIAILIISVLLFFVQKNLDLFKISLTNKLLINLVLVSTAFLLVSALGIQSSKAGSDALSNIFEEKIIPQKVINEMINNFDGITIGISKTLSKFIATEGAKAQFATSRKAIDDFFQNRSQYALFNEGEISKLLDEVQAKYNQSQHVFDALHNAYATADKKELARIGHIEWALVDAYIQKRLNQIKYETTYEVGNIYVKNATSLQQSMGTMLVITLIGLFTAITLSLILNRYISYSISLVNHFIKNIKHHLDLTQTLKLNSKDEFGEISHNFNALVSEMNEVIGGVILTTKVNQELSNDLVKSIENVHNSLDEEDKHLAQTSDMSTTIQTINQQSKTNSERTQHEMHDAKSNLESLTASITSLASLIDVNSESVLENATTLEELAQQTNQIKQVINLIYDIADQTNLLALNAAIEAARAGEHGRGFAVVADEVRTLAEKTQRSLGTITSEINILVQSINDLSHSTQESSKEMIALKDSSLEMQEQLDMTSNIMDNTLIISNEALLDADNVFDQTKNLVTSLNKINTLADQNREQMTLLDNISVVLNTEATQLSTHTARFKTSTP